MGVTIRKDKRYRNRFIVDIKAYGRRKANSFHSREEASAYARAAKKLLAKGKFQFEETGDYDSGDITVAEYYQQFRQEYLTAGVRESTRVSYDGSFELHILPELGKIPLSDLERKRVKKFVGTLIAKGLAKASIRIVLSELCAMLNHALEDELIVRNPAIKLHRLYREVRGRTDEDENTFGGVHEVQIYNRQEVELFLKTVWENSPDYFALFLCALHTGMRSAEIAGLQWGDIDWNQRLMIVRRIVNNRGKVTPTKTNRIRTIDMSSALFNELKEHLERQKLKWSEDRLPKWVFANQDGNPVDMKNVYHRHYLKNIERAGLRRIRFHDLRHTFASMLIQQGESLAYVKDQLGHSSITLTVNTYTHLIPGSNRQAVDKLPSFKKSEEKGKVLSVVKGKK
ncbi:site-specific integrase [bacterium]|nr:site-specific integrase [bacterium]